MKTDVEKKIFSITFMLMLIVPLLLTNTKSNTISEVENRTLAQFPKLHNDEGKINGTYIVDFENWFNDNVGLREVFYETNSKIQYDVFGNSAVDDVVVGKDGWLYYNNYNNLQIATNEYPEITEEELQIICERQIEIKNKLKNQGIEYILFLPPSKVSIYPEYIRGNFDITRTPVDIIADYLEENSDVKVIRLKEALLEEKARKPETFLYFKTDTHWNAYGAYTAYVEITNRMLQWGMVDKGPAEVSFNKFSKMHDLTGMITNADNLKYYEEAITSYNVINPGAHIVTEGKQYSFIQDYVMDNSIRRADYYVNDNSKKAPSFLVFGDSMFMDWLGPLMAENSSSIIGIWSYDIDDDVVNYIKPSVVFLEMTERSLGNLKYVSEDFIPKASEAFFAEN